MSVARTVLLKISDNQWLRANGTRLPFVRRAVSRFMPGESFDDMLGAAKATAAGGIRAVFTRLGENVNDLAEADAVARHYLEVIDRIRAINLACEPSIKLTQLGLDIDRDFAYGHLRDLAARTQAAGSYLWIDMEQSPYVDVTLELTRRLRQEFPAIGVCLQAYLFRTREDLEDITSRGIGVRLVKGAYNEPATVAFPKKSDVDANYLALAQLLLAPAARAAGARAVFGTHDLQLVEYQNVAKLEQLANHYEGSLQRSIISSALASRGEDAGTMDRHIEEAIMWQMPKIDKHVWVLDTSVTLAPLMGLLGTIIGMVHAFDILGTSGTGGAATRMVTGGIAEALVATGAGLFIAIIAVLFLNDFNKRVRLALHQMDLLKVMVINRFFGGGSAHQGVSVRDAHAASAAAIKAGRGV